MRHIWNLFRASVAILLIVAAALKSWNSPIIASQNGLLSHPVVLLFVVVAEAVAGILVWTLPSIAAWRLIVGTFSILGCAAAWSVFSGSDCNCFGEAISSKVTLSIDITVLIVCIAVSLKPSVLREHAGRDCAVGYWRSILIGLAVSIALLTVSHYRDSQFQNAESLEHLLADSWIGKPWPIDNKLSQGLDALRTGNWLVLIARQDCSHCAELISRFFENPNRHRDGERTALFISGSCKWPYWYDRIALEQSIESSSGIVSFETNEPFVASPAIFVIMDGIIQSAADGKDADHFLERILK